MALCEESILSQKFLFFELPWNLLMNIIKQFKWKSGYNETRKQEDLLRGRLKNRLKIYQREHLNIPNRYPLTLTYVYN